MSDADIRYTLDGSEPTVESDIYEGPVYLTENTCVKAVVTDKDNQILEAPAVKNFLVNKATGCTYTLSTDAWSLDWYPVKLLCLRMVCKVLLPQITNGQLSLPV